MACAVILDVGEKLGAVIQASGGHRMIVVLSPKLVCQFIPNRNPISFGRLNCGAGFQPAFPRFLPGVSGLEGWTC